jgi:hypothetical protein
MRLLIPLFFASTLLAAPDQTWYHGSPDYVRLTASVSDSSGKEVTKWRVSVDYFPHDRAWVYSGPPIPAHICAPDDLADLKIHIWAAPPYSKYDGLYPSSVAPRDLSIHLERVFLPIVKLSYYITPEMWLTEEWRSPKPSEETRRLGYTLSLVKADAPKKNEPNQSLQTTTMAVTDAAAQPPRQP